MISHSQIFLHFIKFLGFYSLDSFSLLSVPFFILTGILMNGSGITERVFNFAKATLGHYIGGMGHVNVAASLIFSGMSGSAIADAGGLGQLEIKAMRDEGYDDDICGGLTAASCIIGPLVPPSISMIIYGVKKPGTKPAKNNFAIDWFAITPYIIILMLGGTNGPIIQEAAVNPPQISSS